MLTHLNSEPTNPKRVVVLGSKGFVATHIIQKLKKTGIEVLSLSKESVNLLAESAEARLVECLKPEDALVVTAAIAPCKNASMLVDNLRMMQPVCAVMEKCALSQVVYISSDAVYAEDINPVTETTPLHPLSLHGMMHSARELMLQTCAKQIPLAILRPSLLYGLTDPHNGYGPNRFRRLALEGKTITLFGQGEEKRDHIFIEDVAEIVRLALQHRSEGILNIVTGQSLSFREVAEIIVTQSGKSVEIQGTPRQNPITHRHFDITAHHKAFPKFVFTPFKEGIQRILTELECV